MAITNAFQPDYILNNEQYTYVMQFYFPMTYICQKSVSIFLNFVLQIAITDVDW